MTSHLTSPFFKKLVLWAENNSTIEGIFLVGSYAHGTEKPTSDIDLVIISHNPSLLLDDNTWIYSFDTVTKIQREDWGKLISLRVFFHNHQEIEFGITDLNWISTNPVDTGTKEVVQNGYTILYDRMGLLEKSARIIIAM